MKVKSVREVRNLEDETDWFCVNHVSPQEAVQEYTALFLDLPPSDINFSKLGIGPLIKQIAKTEACDDDHEEIDGFSDKGRQLIFDHLRGLNLDKADVTYALRLRSYASPQEKETAEKEFWAKIKETKSNFLENLLGELSGAVKLFQEGNNGSEYFKELLFSNTYPSLNPRAEYSPAPLLCTAKISKLENMLAERYSSKALKSAGIIVPEREIPPLKFLERLGDLKLKETDPGPRDYMCKLEKLFPDLVQSIPRRFHSGVAVLIMQAQKEEPEKAAQESGGLCEYFEEKVLEDELRSMIPEAHPAVKLYAEKALLEQFFHEDATTQYDYGVPTNRFTSYLTNLAKLGNSSLVSVPPNHKNAQDYREASSRIIGMYNKTISRWDNFSGYDSVQSVIRSKAAEAEQDRNLFVSKHLVFLFGDALYQFGARRAYDCFVDAQKILPLGESKRYLREVIDLFDRVDKLTSKHS